MCVLWPSRISRTGFSVVGRQHWQKCSNHFTNISDCIHPDSRASAMAPGGALSISSGFIRTRGNISMGGMYYSAALIQISTVTR